METSVVGDIRSQVYERRKKNLESEVVVMSVLSFLRLRVEMSATGDEWFKRVSVETAKARSRRGELEILGLKVTLLDNPHEEIILVG